MTLGDALGPGGKRPELYGIGGWLAFLCVTLLILTPIALLTELVIALTTPGMDPTEKGFIIAVDLVVGAFTVVTGLGLVRMWRNALRIAKWYFFISIGLASLATAAFALQPEEATASETVSMVRWLIGSGAWLAYLYRSERVRETYAAARADEAAEVFR